MKNRLSFTLMNMTLLLVPGRDAQAPVRSKPSSASEANRLMGSFQSASFSFDSAKLPNQDLPIELKSSSVTISTTGRPVFVGVIPEGGASQKVPEPYTIAISGKFVSSWWIAILRDSNFEVAGFAAGAGLKKETGFLVEIPFSLIAIDTPDAGTHTYVVRVARPYKDCEIRGARLVAFEL